MPLADHLEDHLALDHSTGCLEWSRCRTPDGYGRVSRNGVSVYVHRLVFEKHYGPIPEGMVVRHSCDNPPCANPSHLLVGTVLENVQDRDTRGRNGTITHGRYIGYSKRPKKSRRKFTDSQVRDIRGRCASGEFKKALGREYGVSDSAILKIVNRQTYFDVV